MTDGPALSSPPPSFSGKEETRWRGCERSTSQRVARSRDVRRRRSPLVSGGKAPTLASREWLFLNEMDDPIERTLSLFSTRKRERSPGGRTMTQRWRAGSTHNRQRVGGVA